MGRSSTWASRSEASHIPPPTAKSCCGGSSHHFAAPSPTRAFSQSGESSLLFETPEKKHDQLKRMAFALSAYLSDMVYFHVCAAASVEPLLKKSLPGSITFHPEADGSLGQLQHRAESEGPDNSLQSGNSGTIARRPAVGINSVLGQRLKDRVPNHQCPS